MKKNDYKKPTMRVVKIQQRLLLNGSPKGPTGTLPDSEEAEELDWNE